MKHTKSLKLITLLLLILTLLLSGCWKAVRWVKWKKWSRHDLNYDPRYRVATNPLFLRTSSEQIQGRTVFYWNQANAILDPLVKHRYTFYSFPDIADTIKSHIFQSECIFQDVSDTLNNRTMVLVLKKMGRRTPLLIPVFDYFYDLGVEDVLLSSAGRGAYFEYYCSRDSASRVESLGKLEHTPPPIHIPAPFYSAVEEDRDKGIAVLYVFCHPELGINEVIWIFSFTVDLKTGAVSNPSWDVEDVPSSTFTRLYGKNRIERNEE